MQKKPLILALLAGLFLSGAAQATLIDRGGGLIYDTVLNITWLQDANYAQTSGTDNQGAIDGLMHWANATVWAADLSYFDAVRNVTYTDWRLPYASVSAGAGPAEPGLVQGCTGAGGANEVVCRDNEMSYMFYYNLDGTFGTPELGTQSGDGVTLNNIQGKYWSGTLLRFESTIPVIWIQTFDNGALTIDSSGVFSLLSAWAVRPGDVVAIPEADTWAMLLAGLTLVGAAARRRRG